MRKALPIFLLFALTTVVPADDLPSAEVPLVIPAAAKQRTNPVPPTEENLERGVGFYASQCAMCHGARGKGDGDLAVARAIRMPDLTDPAEQNKRTDGELFYILTEGHGRMPAEGDRLPEDYRWSMILAVRALGRQAER